MTLLDRLKKIVRGAGAEDHTEVPPERPTLDMSPLEAARAAHKQALDRQAEIEAEGRIAPTRLVRLVLVRARIVELQEIVAGLGPKSRARAGLEITIKQEKTRELMAEQALGWHDQPGIVTPPERCPRPEVAA